MCKDVVREAPMCSPLSRVLSAVSEPTLEVSEGKIVLGATLGQRPCSESVLESSGNSCCSPTAYVVCLRVFLTSPQFSSVARLLSQPDLSLFEDWNHILNVSCTSIMVGP